MFIKYVKLTNVEPQTSIKYTFPHEERIWIAMIDLIKRTTHNRKISLGSGPNIPKRKNYHVYSVFLDIRTIVIIVVLTYLRKVHGKQKHIGHYF